jgi:hypothetical protein
MQYRDLKSVIETAVEEAVGEREQEIAKTAITEGLHDNLIARLTGLRIEQIENLRKEM